MAGAIRACADAVEESVELGLDRANAVQVLGGQDRAVTGGVHALSIGGPGGEKLLPGIIARHGSNMLASLEVAKQEAFVAGALPKDFDVMASGERSGASIPVRLHSQDIRVEKNREVTIGVSKTPFGPRHHNKGFN